MNPDEAEATAEQGDRLLEAVGDIPAAYGFACQLPEVDDLEMHELDRIWMDRFEADHRDWIVVLNGTDQHREIESLGITLEAGTAYVVADSTRLCRITPLGVQWYFDADTGDRLEGEKDIQYWDSALIEALYGRLVENGKDLPPVSEIMDWSDDGQTGQGEHQTDG